MLDKFISSVLCRPSEEDALIFFCCCCCCRSLLLLLFFLDLILEFVNMYVDVATRDMVLGAAVAGHGVSAVAFVRSNDTDADVQTVLIRMMMRMRMIRM